MLEPVIEILGVYKIQMSDQELRSYIKESYGRLLSAQEQKKLFEIKREELMAVVGLDVLVKDADVISTSLTSSRPIAIKQLMMKFTYPMMVSQSNPPSNLTIAKTSEFIFFYIFLIQINRFFQAMVK
jgi:hypothetical protein